MNIQDLVTLEEDEQFIQIGIIEDSHFLLDFVELLAKKYENDGLFHIVNLLVQTEVKENNNTYYLREVEFKDTDRSVIIALIINKLKIEIIWKTASDHCVYIEQVSDQFYLYKKSDTSFSFYDQIEKFYNDTRSQI